MSQTFAQRAYNHIREKLFDGEFQPGARLRYGPISKEIGVSVTPVREAMGKLATEGFVELVPELGAVVRTLSPEETIEVCQIRAALEPCAAAWAAKNLRDSDLDKLQSTLDQMIEIGRRLRRSGEEVMPEPMEREHLALEMGFHGAIIEASGNRALVKIISDFRVLARAMRTKSTPHNLRRVALAYREHRRVLRALKRRDSMAAYLAMEQHMRSAFVDTLAECLAGRGVLTNGEPKFYTGSLAGSIGSLGDFR